MIKNTVKNKDDIINKSLKGVKCRLESLNMWYIY